MSHDQFFATPPLPVAVPDLEAPVANLNTHSRSPTTPPEFHGLLAMDITDEDVKPIIVDSPTPPMSIPKTSVSIDVASEARSGPSSASRPNDRSFRPGPYDPTKNQTPSKGATLVFRRSSRQLHSKTIGARPRELFTVPRVCKETPPPHPARNHQIQLQRVSSGLWTQGGLDTPHGERKGA